MLNQITNADISYLGMSNSTINTTTVTNRYVETYQMLVTYGYFGLGGITYNNTYNGIYSQYVRDSNKNQSIILAPLKISPFPVHFSYFGAISGGSIDAKAPYLYCSHGATFNHLDETTIGSNTYTAIKITSGAGTLLLKQA